MDGIRYWFELEVGWPPRFWPVFWWAVYFALIAVAAWGFIRFAVWRLFPRQKRSAGQ